MSGAPGATEPQPDARRLNELVPALLDFEKRPGRYRLALREPGILFEQPHAVLLLAAGRAVKGLAPLKPGPAANAVQQAARYFVRAAMLRPNADHYTLLGLTPGFDPQTLRDHYRLMIRLTHPDFASSADDWPPDAASRINLANDVLGNVVKRSNYNATLQAEKSAASPPSEGSGAPLKPAAAAKMPPTQGARPDLAARRYVKRIETPEPSAGWSGRSKMIMAGAGALACMLALWLMTPSGEGGSLVAHRSRPTATSVATATATPPADPAAGDQALALNPAGELALQPAPALNGPSALGAVALLDALPDTVSQPPETNAAEAPRPPTEAENTGLRPPTPPAGANPPAPASAPLPQRATAAPEAPSPAALSVSSAPSPAPLPSPLKAKPAATPPTSVDKALAASPSQSTSEIALHRQSDRKPPPADRRTAKPDPVLASAPNARTSLSSAPLRANSETGPSAMALAPLPAAAVAETAAPSTPPTITPPPLQMADVQPKLAKIVEALDAGRSDMALRLIDPASSTSDARIAFLRNYYDFQQGQKVMEMVSSSFRSQNRDSALVVHGALKLRLVNVMENQFVRDLNIKATFERKNGQAVLTRLESSYPKP